MSSAIQLGLLYGWSRVWDGYVQVMEGMQEGTLFNRDVVEAEENASRCTSTAASEDGDSLETARDMALAARTASRKLAACPTEVALSPMMNHMRQFLLKSTGICMPEGSPCHALC